MPGVTVTAHRRRSLPILERRRTGMATIPDRALPVRMAHVVVITATITLAITRPMRRSHRSSLSHTRAGGSGRILPRPERKARPTGNRAPLARTGQEALRQSTSHRPHRRPPTAAAGKMRDILEYSGRRGLTNLGTRW